MSYMPKSKSDVGAGTLTGHNSSVTCRDMSMIHVSSIISTQKRSESHTQNYG